MFLNVGLPMGAVCWTLPPRICCITPLKVCSIWLALISDQKWFYNSTQVSNIKTHRHTTKQLGGVLREPDFVWERFSKRWVMPFSDFMFVLFGKRGIFAPPFGWRISSLPRWQTSIESEAKTVEGHLHCDEAEAIDRTVGTYTVQVHGLAARRSEASCWRIKQRIQWGT